MVLLLPLSLLTAAFSAALIHECCHLLALWAFHVPIMGIKIRTTGAEIQTAPIKAFEEFLCAAAGPAGSFLCLTLYRPFPFLALCGFLQGIYNLLPIYPMDGGRMLRCIMSECFPSHATSICRAITILTSFTLILAFSVLWIRTMDAFFLIIGTYFIFKTLRCRKTPCKEG